MVFQGPIKPGTSEEAFRETGKSVNLFQGPVRPGTDVKYFRRTGTSRSSSGSGSSKQLGPTRAEFEAEAERKQAELKRQQEEAKKLAMVMEKALLSVIDLKAFPNAVVDVFVELPQTDAGTRCAGINAAAMALAHAGIPMKDMVSSIAVGKIDKTIVLDLDKYEDSEFDEGEGSTDIPMSFTKSGELTHLQLDGKISKDQLKEAIEMAKKACEEIYEVQKKALKDSVGDVK